MAQVDLGHVRFRYEDFTAEQLEELKVKGDPGSDGFSPVITLTKNGSELTISVTDAEGTKTATITEGADIEYHTSDTTAHITKTERTNWNAAKDHAESTHARTDATRTANSETNGNVLINGVETTVYTHPGSGTNPHGTTKTDLGLGSVENKSSETIRSELTKKNVTDALGYTPPTTDTTYSQGSSSALGLTKLYGSTGTKTDGAMTQSAVSAAIDSCGGYIDLEGSTLILKSKAGGNLDTADLSGLLGGAGTVYQADEPVLGLVTGLVWIG